jgi:hypothetical protein
MSKPYFCYVTVHVACVAARGLHVVLRRKIIIRAHFALYKYKRLYQSAEGLEAGLGDVVRDQP